MSELLALQDCPVCLTNDWRIVYDGPIRDGLFVFLPTQKKHVAQVVECGSCLLQRLKEFALADSDYETEEYRIKYNGTSNDRALLELHDEEQAHRVTLIGTKSLRGSTVVDVGCGHGAFLDSIGGLAANTIGIEPFTALHGSLVRRGHQVFSPSDLKLAKFRSKADLVTSFGVMEHLEDPYQHLTFAWNLVKPGGRLVLQTDNLDEILFQTGAPGFKDFFYRTAHNWYFAPETMKKIAVRAGLNNIKVSTFHEFGFSNFVNWHKQAKPTGDNHDSLLGSDFEAVWKSSIEHRGFGSLVTLLATKNEG